jgi:hypothetical protein
MNIGFDMLLIYSENPEGVECNRPISGNGSMQIFSGEVCALQIPAIRSSPIVKALFIPLKS